MRRLALCFALAACSGGGAGVVNESAEPNDSTAHELGSGGRFAGSCAAQSDADVFELDPSADVGTVRLTLTADPLGTAGLLFEVTTDGATVMIGTVEQSVPEADYEESVDTNGSRVRVRLLCAETFAQDYSGSLTFAPQ